MKAISITLVSIVEFPPTLPDTFQLQGDKPNSSYHFYALFSLW